MKTVFKNITLLTLFLWMATACTSDFNHPSQDGIPLAADIDYKITVNQETNEVTFTLNNFGCNPIWIFNGKDYSTVNGLTRIFSLAGTYEVEIKISNANGVSDGSKKATFTLENSLIINPVVYDPNHDSNLWKNSTITYQCWYAPGWSQIADPEIVANGNSHTISLPAATTDQWQAQVGLLSNISTTSAKNYDCRMVFNSNKDLDGVTVKLEKYGDGDISYFVERISLKAYEDYLFSVTDMEGIEMEQVKLMLDFGGNSAETEVNVKWIVLKDHSEDDGFEN